VPRRTTSPPASDEHLEQDIAFRFDQLEIGPLAEHDPHLDLDSVEKMTTPVTLRTAGNPAIGIAVRSSR
jgi:hypothetical protein